MLLESDGLKKSGRSWRRSMTRFLIRSQVLMCALLISRAASFANTIMYTVVDMGALPGGHSGLFGLNQAGIAVGWSLNSSYESRAVLFGQGGLWNLDTAGNTNSSQARGINNLGQVVGTSFIGPGAEATIWSGGAASTLGTLGGTESYGLAINDHGQVVGSSTTADGEARAFVSNGNGLTDLQINGIWSAAYSINNLGQIVGTVEVEEGVFRAFLWDPVTGYQLLGTLGGDSSYAMAINDSGAIAGSSRLSNGQMRAFLYQNGVMTSLGTLGGDSSYAYGLNSAGHAVGYSTTADGQTSAFLFRDGMLFDLNALIGPGSGWILDEAFAINDLGQIVGTGWHDGQRRGFLLQPAAPSFPGAEAPEPGTWVMMATGLLLIEARWCRRNGASAGHECPKS